MLTKFVLSQSMKVSSFAFDSSTQRILKFYDNCVQMASHKWQIRVLSISYRRLAMVWMVKCQHLWNIAGKLKSNNTSTLYKDGWIISNRIFLFIRHSSTFSWNRKTISSQYFSMILTKHLKKSNAACFHTPMVLKLLIIVQFWKQHEDGN